MLCLWREMGKLKKLNYMAFHVFFSKFITWWWNFFLDPKKGPKLHPLLGNKPKTLLTYYFFLRHSVLNKGGDFQLQSRLQPLLQNIGQLVVNQTPLFSSHDFTFRGPPCARREQASKLPPSCFCLLLIYSEIRLHALGIGIKFYF